MKGHGAKGNSTQQAAAWGEVFSFTLTNGSVTAGSLTLPSGSTVSLPLSGTTKYSVSGSEVIATYTNGNVTQEIHFADSDADGLYNVVSSSQVELAAPQSNWLGFVNREQLKATVDTSGTVSAVSQVSWHGNERVLLSSTVSDSNTTWTVQNGLLVETHTLANGTSQWEVFRDGNADGVYTEVASGTGTLINLTGVLTQTDAVAASL